ncbi:NepR family anti-sigma factor [Salinarimonas soli]|uniref:Anti-sigma factor NepR domain-containing protein n=1 Tax=Salinarimonas soli TaxID=1638099 RepID=A0A5B2VAJ8_9HYPH|nr:NepR family anti-sigma factor [Salinarimonas soli]KAA2235422.1 hypothetical protein F0L46_19525 [Salinarimonas soli]
MATNDERRPGRAPSPRVNGPYGSDRLQPELTAFIGRRMREAYEPMIQEPVPDRIAEMLQTLAAREKGGR